MSNENLVCPICEEPTYLVGGKNPRKDRLCSKHSTLLFHKKIEQCPDCEKWKNTGEECTCKNITNKADLKERTKTEERLNAIIIDKGIRCITCGYETDGKLFCKRCYAKYCNKEILIKIKNCREIVPLDDFYEGYFECDDGHVVKSMAERDIDDYLFANNIKRFHNRALCY